MNTKCFLLANAVAVAIGLVSSTRAASGVCLSEAAAMGSYSLTPQTGLESDHILGWGAFYLVSVGADASSESDVRITVVIDGIDQRIFFVAPGDSVHFDIKNPRRRRVDLWIDAMYVPPVPGNASWTGSYAVFP